MPESFFEFDNHAYLSALWAEYGVKKRIGECFMSYVAPSLIPRFESLSVDLKNAILERDVQLNTLSDLIQVLEQIVAEGEQ